MAHQHYCEQCGVAVAICSDDGCVGPDGYGWFCTLHHPAPEHHQDLVQPVKRTIVTIPTARG
jgi:hypothetical protein